MIQRKSIKRKAIKVSMHMRTQIKISELQETTKNESILEISEHYNMLARQVLNKPGYLSLSVKDPMSHKNWVHFERVYEVCRMKEWDSKLYVEAQFDRCKKWGAKKYPFPNMMYSVAAFKYFTNYLSILEQTYKKDTNVEKRKRGKETKSLQQEIVDDIVASIKSLSFYITHSAHKDKSQYKALRIYQSWEELSPYYLWSVPWFHSVLPDTQSMKTEMCVSKFELIRNSPVIRHIISVTVPQVEKYFDIPPNIELG